MIDSSLDRIVALDKIPDRLSRKISRIGVACAMLVVFIHSYLAHAPDEPFNPVASFAQEFLSQGIARVAVPFFFAVSGFFLYRDYEFTFAWFRRKLASRFWSLGVPYVLWALIGLVFAVVTSMFARKVGFEAFQWSSPMWWIRTLGVIEKPLYLGQLWFVHMLMEWLCLAPLVGLAVRKFKFAVPAACFVIMCIPSLANPWTNALMYISLGASIGMHENTGLRVPFLVSVVFAVTGFLFFAAKALLVALNCGPLPHWHLFVAAVLGLPAVWFGYDLIEERIPLGWLDGFAGSAFFIYCSHNIFLAIFRSPLRRLSIWEFDILRYMLPPVLSICVAILTWSLLGRTAPRLRDILCGGRGNRGS